MKFRPLLGLTLVLAMLLLAGCGTAIPDVKGKTATQAEDALKAAGFTLGKITYSQEASGALGAVIAQEPAAGTRSKSGAMVVVTVAGPPPVAIPSLVGLDRASAEAALGASGLTVGTVTESFSTTAPVGMVISQTPVGQMEAPRGSGVTLFVSEGVEPVVVPSVKGKKEAEAKSALQTAGFVAKVTKKTNKAKKGVVIAQSPSGGTAQPGSTVAITVSSGVEMVKVPDVVGQIYVIEGLDAPGAVREAFVGYANRHGFDCVVTFRDAPSYQTPRAGTKVAKGTTIHVRIQASGWDGQ